MDKAETPIIQNFFAPEYLIYKEIFTHSEASRYLGIAQSKLYKHTSSGNITFYKPEGRHNYYHKDDLDKWMLRNKQLSNKEISRIAENKNRNS
ncbi:excisionase family DNA binding protein [Nonlabens xylanidelens]|uniref:Excisionase family DNA binding protein n=1 Tax=Nonlabens xylanidelens TaxID=191564 RepID=A0A2S6IFU6_9FLAO|nr:helix-turn-helix domain-containing protein [Nonlabens xylanidelens]PPK93056.1 excisionase family DNA binding protein [Nonlabens xylanidelens]PQJ18739.1 hypothetical protein BST94_06895 [Nonlabens xylanidelens]